MSNYEDFKVFPMDGQNLPWNKKEYLKDLEKKIER